MQDIDAAIQDAIRSYEQGNLHRTHEICQQILRSTPTVAKAWDLLGLTMLSVGKSEQAVKCMRQSVTLNPNDANFHIHLGVAYRAFGRLDDAIASYRNALLVAPHAVEAHNNLGNAFKEQGRSADAEASYREALRLQPNFAIAYNNLATVRAELGDLPGAHDLFREAVRLAPKDPTGWMGLTRCLNELGRHQEALDYLRPAIQAWPNLAEFYVVLGFVYDALNNLDEAEACYNHAFRLKPQSTADLNSVGRAFIRLGRVKDALDCFRQAINSKPDHSTHSHLVFTLNYDPDIRTEDLAAEHQRWAERYAVDPERKVTHDNDPDPDRRLRIGYVSPDFRRNVVNYFFEPMLLHHNRETVEVFLYGDVHRPDDTTARLQEMAPHWRDIHKLTTDEAAEQIRSDKIDLLIDLAGHCGRNRLTLFAQRPAPVQITYLGYCFTTGMSQMDFRFTDNVADPSVQDDRCYTEQLVRLPEVFACYQPSPEAPAISPLPAMEHGHITFGSLHNLRKINAHVIDLWAELLRRLPQSRLLFFRNTLVSSLRKHLSSEFERRGISSSQLEMRQEPVQKCSHLSVYADVDISLDVFPWSGHATACESLWMGVPVVTLRGSRHAGRMVASVLTALGRTEWIAETADAYASIAVDLASDVEQLAGMRANLREQMAKSPVCDGSAHARRIEDAYRSIWRQWCAKDLANN